MKYTAGKNNLFIGDITEETEIPSQKKFYSNNLPAWKEGN